MHARSPSPFPLLLLLLLLLLFLFLVVAADLDIAVPPRSRSPSPSPSPAPAPAPAPVPFSVPKDVASNRGGLQLPPPPPAPLSCHFNCHRGPSQRQHGIGLAPSLRKKELNFGEKLGLAFAAVAITLQVVLGSFLVFKRMQLKKLEDPGGRGRPGLPS